jgi:hypothetical protein
MRTTFTWRHPTITAACLVVLTTVGLARVEQASAQNRALFNLTSGSEAAPESDEPAPPAAAGGCANCSTGTCSQGGCAADGCDECPACSGRGCPHCNGTGRYRGCRECREGLRREHHGLLAHHGYWDGRRECEDCPYGKDVCGECCEPRWAVTAGTIIMRRSTARKGVVISNTNNGASLVSMDDLDLDWSAGPRIDIIRRFEAFDIEFMYWGIDNWEDGFVVTGNNNLAVPINGFAGQTYSLAGAAYQSRLYNFENNVKLRMAEAVNLILGARFMELHEKFFVGAGTGVTGQELDALAGNHLYGFQIGADTDVPIWAGISFNLFIKGGVFANHINQRWTTYSFPQGGWGGGEVQNDETAFVGETGVTATWQVNKNLGVFAGYQFMWIDGVMLAPDMVTDGAARTNTPHYQGGLAGLTLQW